MPSYFTPKDPLEELDSYFDKPDKAHLTMNPYSSHVPAVDLLRALGPDNVKRIYGDKDALMSQAKPDAQTGKFMVPLKPEAAAQLDEKQRGVVRVVNEHTEAQNVQDQMAYFAQAYKPNTAVRDDLKRYGVDKSFDLDPDNKNFIETLFGEDRPSWKSKEAKNVVYQLNDLVTRSGKTAEEIRYIMHRDPKAFEALKAQYPDSYDMLRQEEDTGFQIKADAFAEQKSKGDPELKQKWLDWFYDTYNRKVRGKQNQNFEDMTSDFRQPSGGTPDAFQEYIQASPNKQSREMTDEEVRQLPVG